LIRSGFKGWKRLLLGTEEEEAEEKFGIFFYPIG
jgi:hypothetical protein